MKLDALVDLVESRVKGRFFGKYPGVVDDVKDPLGLGRIRARVPAVLGEEVLTGWALPCAPFGGGHGRGMLFLPQKGDTVWIEFAAGDVGQPIWVGCFWGSPEGSGGKDDLGTKAGNEVPEAEEGKRAGPGVGLLRTGAGHQISFEEDGGVRIVHGGGEAEIELTKAGEVIVHAKKVKLGSEGARQALVLGDDFMQLFNTHTHGTGVGPSSPPTQPMTAAHLSQKCTTD